MSTIDLFSRVKRFGSVWWMFISPIWSLGLRISGYSEGGGGVDIHHIL